MSSEALDPQFVQHVEEALAEVSGGRDVGPITSERPLAELGLDSVSLAELVVVLEDRLGVTLENEEIKAVRTFGDLQGLVRRLTASSS